MSLTNAWIVPDCDTVLDWLSSIAEDRSSGFLRKMDTPRNLTLILWTLPFLRAMLGISRHAVSVRPSVCPSACPSRSCILSKRLNISSNFLTSNSHTIRVLHTKRYGSIPTEPPPLTEAFNACGVGKNRDSPPISGSVGRCERFDRQMQYTPIRLIVASWWH